MVFTKKVNIEQQEHLQKYTYVCILDQRTGDGPKKQDSDPVLLFQCYKLPSVTSKDPMMKSQLYTSSMNL